MARARCVWGLGLHCYRNLQTSKCKNLCTNILIEFEVQDSWNVQPLFPSSLAVLFVRKYSNNSCRIFVDLLHPHVSDETNKLYPTFQKQEPSPMLENTTTFRIMPTHDRKMCQLQSAMLPNVTFVNQRATQNINIFITHILWGQIAQIFRKYDHISQVILRSMNISETTAHITKNKFADKSAEIVTTINQCVRWIGPINMKAL